MISWIRTLGLKFGIDFVLDFIMGLIGHMSDQGIAKLKEIVIKQYLKAKGTDMEWDDALWAFFRDLIADPEDQPLFMKELKEALADPLTDLYRYCVEETDTEVDESLVLLIFAGLGLPVPKLKTVG